MTNSTSTMQELLACDNEEFVLAAYAVALGRPPDPSGRENLLTRLQWGVAKQQLLQELFDSDEGCARGDRRPEFFRLAHRPAEMAIAVEPRVSAAPSFRPLVFSDLMTVDDRCFIDLICQALLGRRADAQGLSAYVRMLDCGDSKLAVVAHLAASPESRAQQLVLAEWGRVARSGGRAALGQVARAPNEATATSPCVAMPTDALVQCAPDAFVANVYNCLLGRSPEREAAERYGAHCHDPAGRTATLSQIWKSDEAQAAHQFRQELWRRAGHFKLYQRPILGRILQIFMGVQSENAMQRRLRRIERRLVAASRPNTPSPEPQETLIAAPAEADLQPSAQPSAQPGAQPGATEAVAWQREDATKPQTVKRALSKLKTLNS